MLSITWDEYPKIGMKDLNLEFVVGEADGAMTLKAKSSDKSSDASILDGDTVIVTGREEDDEEEEEEDDEDEEEEDDEDTAISTSLESPCESPELSPIPDTTPYLASP